MHGYIRTQNHEVVLHFTIACCNIGVYTGVYCYIVVLVHGYIRAQNQGCSVTPVSCCSTSSLAQLRPTIHNTGRLDHDTHKFSTIPTNSWASPQCGFHTDALISADPFLISLDICVSTKIQIHIHNTGRLDPDTHKFSVHCWIHRCLDFSPSTSEATIYAPKTKLTFITLKDQPLICHCLIFSRLKSI